jgi:hypothetical protein
VFGGGRGVVLVVALVAGGSLAAGRRAHADNGSGDVKAFNERCANRLSIAFLGKTATPDQMAAADPKQAIDGLMKSADFQERFARFINKDFNDAPGATTMDDGPYWIATKVLATGAPWSDMFLGKYRLVSIASNPAVESDDNGLGYFRSGSPDPTLHTDADGWYGRYEGNESNGVKIATAYRIMHNVVGLRLTASTATVNSDRTATGRQAEPCVHCHYEGWYALDKVASVLPVKGQAYNAYNGGPKEMLGGQQIASDKELVTALVASENFSVNACRLAFKFLYAREDNRCEGPLLDRCVDTFKQQKTIQSALAVIAGDTTFCE